MKEYFEYKMGKRDCLVGNPPKPGMCAKYYQGYSDQQKLKVST